MKNKKEPEKIDWDEVKNKKQVEEIQAKLKEQEHQSNE